MYRFQVTVEVSYLDGEEGISQADIAEVLRAVANGYLYRGDKAQLVDAGEYIRYELTDEDVKEID